MTKDSARSILDWGESDNPHLSNIIKKAHILSKLEKVIRSLLPQEIATDCFVSLQSRTRLVLFSRSASTATRLRYLLPELLTQLRQTPDYAFISGIDCKVQPDLPGQSLPEKTGYSNTPNLSKEAQKHINDFAKTLLDKELKEALLKLGKED